MPFLGLTHPQVRALLGAALARAEELDTSVALSRKEAAERRALGSAISRLSAARPLRQCDYHDEHAAHAHAGGWCVGADA